MTRYFASHKVTKGVMSTGFETFDEAKARAEWLATTYGGIAKASNNDPDNHIVKSYSAKKGWN